jgi:hypothetical protein
MKPQQNTQSGYTSGEQNTQSGYTSGEKPLPASIEETVQHCAFKKDVCCI